MNIIFKNKSYCTDFEHLDIGDTFVFGKKLYVKITYGGAFCFTDNQMATFGEGTMIRPVVSEMVVYAEE